MPYLSNYFIPLKFHGQLRFRCVPIVLPQTSPSADEQGMEAYYLAQEFAAFGEEGHSGFPHVRQSPLHLCRILCRMFLVSLPSMQDFLSVSQCFHIERVSYFKLEVVLPVP